MAMLVLSVDSGVSGPLAPPAQTLPVLRPPLAFVPPARINPFPVPSPVPKDEVMFLPIEPRLPFPPPQPLQPFDSSVGLPVPRPLPTAGTPLVGKRPSPDGGVRTGTYSPDEVAVGADTRAARLAALNSPTILARVLEGGELIRAAADDRVAADIDDKLKWLAAAVALFFLLN